MFNRTVIVEGSQVAPAYPQTVIEKRAPTEESIRLYKEMREKIEAEYTKVILDQMEPNSLTHAKIERQVNFMEGNVSYHIAFRLNGHDHRVEVKSFEDSRDKVIREILGALAVELGADLEKQTWLAKVPR